MTHLDYTVFDVDNHYYETPDCFTRYIEPDMADRTVRLETVDGKEQVYVGSKPYIFFADPFPRGTVDRPGSLAEMLRMMQSGHYEEGRTSEPVQPAYLNRKARLDLMDDQGVEAAVLLPTMALTVEHHMREDIPLTYASLHSYNRWLDDEWGFAHQNRIYAPPLMSLLDVDRAVAELDWVLDRGARIVHLRPGPFAGRSPADPHFDPFWARINEARVVVGFHVSESGYNELLSTAWGEVAEPTSHTISALQWTCFMGNRPIMDTMAALIFHNLFGRFPDVRVATIENGSMWVPYLLKAMDKMKGMGRNGLWPGGRFPGRPSEVFKQHVFVSPFHEEHILDLVELIGASQVLFGSDFPHPEGLAEPKSFAKLLDGLDEASIRLIMRDNTRELLQGAR